MFNPFFTAEGRPKKLWDSFQPSLSRPVETLHQHQSQHMELKPLSNPKWAKSVITNIARDRQLDHEILCAIFSRRCWSRYALNCWFLSASSSGLHSQSHLFKAPSPPPPHIWQPLCCRVVLMNDYWDVVPLCWGHREPRNHIGITLLLMIIKRTMHAKPLVCVPFSPRMEKMFNPLLFFNAFIHFN